MSTEVWRSVQLGEIASIKHGWPFKSENFSEDLTGRPIVVAIGNFEYTGGFRFASTTTKEYRGDYPREYELTPGDILVVMTCQTPGGEILGIPARVPNDGRVYLHNQRIGKVVITRPDLVDADFLYWVFLWQELNRELVASSSGTKIVHTAPSRIEAFRFDLPPLGEQRAIARLLGNLEKKWELNRRTNRTLESTAAALFQSWFVDFDPVIAKAGGGRTVGVPDTVWAEMPESFDQDGDRRLPHGWTRRPLGDVVAINARHVASDFPHTAIEYLDISSVDRGRHDSSTLIDLVAAPSRARRLAMNGDVLWSCVRPNRRSYLLVTEPPDNLVVSTGFAVLSPRLIPSSFLYLSVTTDDFVDFLTANAAGSAYPAVRPETFARAAIVVPPKGILDGFDRLVSPMLALIAANERENRTLSALRDTLVPQLLSGSIRLHNAEEAVAGAL
ncbi:MAG TPA: restriction endonuclease subunit S [Gemmatimonadaceae bacterium]|nr:restriction endonuclease subunit S [Gemmatimonadaceae bacterium]